VIDGRRTAHPAGVFRALVVDEAHRFRNPKSFSYQAISWVRADFNMLITVTPVWGYPRDFEGLLTLCEPPSLSNDAVKGLSGFPRDTDPWLLSAGDKRQKLCFTT
jgi:SNF2-related domain